MFAKIGVNRIIIIIIVEARVHEYITGVRWPNLNGYNLSISIALALHTHDFMRVLLVYERQIGRNLSHTRIVSHDYASMLYMCAITFYRARGPKEI